MWWRVLVAVLSALALVWVVLVAALLLGRPSSDRLRDTMRLLPDVLRLLGRLAKDPELPRGVRVRLWLLLAYLASPLDLVPDFIPVVGYADDAVLVAWVLRSVVRRAGPAAVRRHWPGTPEGLQALERAVGLSAPDPR
jgi:uncharacterized membrane protein YkvA (DUF1232 family)